MSAHYPARPDYTDADREAGILPPVTIDGDTNQLRIGDSVFLGNYILRGGISIQPGDDSFNTLTVTFIVGSIDVNDSALARVSVSTAGQGV